MLNARNLGFRKKKDCTISIAKTKALISFAVTAKLVCTFVFAYADCWFSHAQAQIRWELRRKSCFQMYCVVPFLPITSCFCFLVNRPNEQHSEKIEFLPMRQISYCEADQHLCFRYMDSTILLKSKISSL